MGGDNVRNTLFLNGFFVFFHAIIPALATLSANSEDSRPLLIIVLNTKTPAGE